MTRTLVNLTTALLLAAPVALLPAAEDKPVRPNILCILADDLGWKDVGYAGSTLFRTPNIDRPARGGMQFSRAYARGFSEGFQACRVGFTS